MKKDFSSTIYLAMFVMVFLKIIDFHHLKLLDVCLLIAFAVMVIQKIYKKYGR